MCKARCWRWLFGNKIPIALRSAGVYGYHGMFFMSTSKKNFFYRKFPHLINKVD